MPIGPSPLVGPDEPAPTGKKLRIDKPWCQAMAAREQRRLLDGRLGIFFPLAGTESQSHPFLVYRTMKILRL
jgi:hypothetical protein